MFWRRSGRPTRAMLLADLDETYTDLEHTERRLADTQAELEGALDRECPDLTKHTIGALADVTVIEHGLEGLVLDGMLDRPSMIRVRDLIREHARVRSLTDAH